MAIRDRGKKKWQFAFGMPELIKGHRDMWRDSERIAKPIIDVYKLEEFDQLICYALEFSLPVKLTLWSDGFTEEITGRVHYVDPLTHQLHIEVETGESHRIDLEDVVGMVVVE